MTIALLDFEGLARACAAGRLDDFADHPRLGWTLTEPLRVALIQALERTNFHAWFSYGRSAFTLADALAVITDAATNEAGIATTERLRGGLGKEIAIGFRVADAVCFGVRYASNLPMNPGQLWPELKPWFKALERNRPRLEAWAASEGVLRFPLAATAAAPADDTTGDELLAAIVAEPDATEPRLVYADWLIARGDARGELIQLCEHRRSLTVADPELDRRIEGLTKEYGERIAGEVAQLAKHYTLVRGFVGRVVMAAPTFAKHGDRLLDQHPITELELQPADVKGLTRLGKAPVLARLRGLRIGQIIGREKPTELAPLTDSTLYTALERLTIWNWQTAGEPRDGFARWPVAKLRELHLHDVANAGQILAGIAHNETVRLTKLQIDSRYRVAWEPGSLAAASLAGLVELRLRIPNEVDELFAGAALPALEQLVVSAWPSDAPEMGRLRRLGISEKRVDLRTFEAILDRCPGLRALQISAMDLDQSTAAIERALALPSDHPLVALHVPSYEVESELLERLRERFPRSYYDPV